MSETKTVRSIVTNFLVNNVKPCTTILDLGYGGDRLIATAITMDLPQKYTTVGNNDPQNLYGDCRNLYWFADNVIDCVFSSHLLEDFENTQEVLAEWVRVIKPGGYCILCLPHEMKFREHCKRTGQSYNYAHKCPDMNIPFMKGIFDKVGLVPSFEWEEHPYSFLLIGKKSYHDGIIHHS